MSVSVIKANKVFSKEFILSHDEDMGDIDIYNLKGKYLKCFCCVMFCRYFKIPAKLIRRRSHFVRITIEFLKER